MKHFYLFAATALALASCANDEFLGETPLTTQQKTDGSIMFTPMNSKMTRADNIIGSVAAEKLHNHFIVYGFKNAAAEAANGTGDEKVFDNYDIAYKDNSAGTSEENTRNWGYIGNTAYSSITGNQSIKYWDHSAANGYVFTAVAALPETSNNNTDYSFPKDATNDKVQFTKVTSGTTIYDKGYTILVKNGASIGDIYISDRTPVTKECYNKNVTLTFRNLTAKVRVGFYETVPGYSVKIENFYTDNDAAAAITTTAAMNTANASNFVAAYENVSTTADNTFTVTYYDGTNNTALNQPKFTNTTATYLHTLTLGDQIQAATSLATSSALPTWDKTSGEYTSVFPTQANTQGMIVKVDYTLTSTDGSGETIKVKGANAFVPVQYCQWKPNYAYTYIFKISDNTNGTTGAVDSNYDPTDPKGLFPITFDAVVVNTDDLNQETITTVAEESVTSYQKGNVVTVYDEYKAGDIYVTNASVTSSTAIGTATSQAQVYTVSASNSEPISEATVKAELCGNPNGLTLTAVTPAATRVDAVPAADGSSYNIKAIKFTGVVGTTYAYVYAKTAYVAPTYTAVGAGEYSSTTVYYAKTNNNVYYPVSGLTEDNFAANKANLYTQTNAGTSGAYYVKVIKVTDKGITLSANTQSINVDGASTITCKDAGKNIDGGAATVLKKGSSADWTDATTATADTDYTIVNHKDGTYTFTGKVAGTYRITIKGKAIDITVTTATT